MSCNFEELVGPTLLIGEGQEVYTKDLLKDKKYVMLYFSAQWCPPCRRFTPLLSEAYTAHKQYIQDNNNAATEEDIEVIFVSLDSVQTDFDTYRSKMPFYSVPFANLWLLHIKDKLSSRYGVRSIPTLVILNGQDGSVITKNGKGEYATYFKGEYEVPSSCCIS
mmetsp:Transcript_13468/g.20790  ORF Transcript_13468/g.20790 Transcript_13468/m.20790 type:complete len:164 (+) Transcript_13468:139-630(+)